MNPTKAPWLPRVLLDDGMRARRMKLGLGAAFVFSVALVLRLYAIDRESLWLDEAYTRLRAGLPLGETIAQSMARYHNPTYFVFMHFWTMLGDDEFWLRLPSAIAGALTAPVVFLTAYQLAGARAGLVAGFLTAIAPEQVYYGQEARMYAMLGFAASLAMLGFAWLATHRSQACRPLFFLKKLWPDARPPSRNARLAWGACFAGLIGTLHLHNTGVVFLCAAAVAVGVLALACGKRAARLLANAALITLGALATWLPYAASLLAQTKRLSEEFWEVFPSLDRSLKIARQLYLLDARIDSVIGALVLGFLVAAILRLHRRWFLLLAFALLAVLGPTIMLLLSLHTPILGARLLIWAGLPLFVLVGAGVSHLRHPNWTLLFCVVVFGMTWPRLEKEYEFQAKERWRDIHAAILPRLDSDTLIVASTRQELASLRYYFERNVDPLEPIPMVESPESPITRSTSAKEARKRMERAGHLVLIDRKGGKRNRELVAKLKQQGKLLSTAYWDRLRVEEFLIKGKRAPGRKKLKPLKGGTKKIPYKKYRAKRRER